jgi:Fe2+ or Zn2+ uptake regulation protein
MSLETIQTEERRLAALKILAKSPGRSANAYVVLSGLNAIGHVSTLDQVRGALAWLEEQDLIKTEDLGGGMVVASLRQRGDEVQAGLARHPGVAKPYPAP